MKKWFAAWCGLTAACAMTTSCSMMQDDLDDCPTGLYLSFKYDYNLQRADMFNDHVGAVTVYVFDEEGRYVTKQEGACPPFFPVVHDAHEPRPGQVQVFGIGRAEGL